MSVLSLGRHGAPVRVLHWTVAGLIPPQFALGVAAERVGDRQLSDALLAMHFQLGMLILGLMLARVAWRLARAAPSAPRSGPRDWPRDLRRCTHGALYVLLLALPLSGYVIWIWMGATRELLGLVEVPTLFVPPNDETGRALAWYVHVHGATLLAALLALHVAAALHHRFMPRRSGRAAHASATVVDATGAVKARGR